MVNSGRTREDAIPALGEGWVAEEALAIWLYCALSAQRLEDGIINKVNITVTMTPPTKLPAIYLGTAGTA
jgi:ADP-ribosylglycohydrolase